jgi:hypothetical protein
VTFYSSKQGHFSLVGYQQMDEARSNGKFNSQSPHYGASPPNPSVYGRAFIPGPFLPEYLMFQLTGIVGDVKLG